MKEMSLNLIKTLVKVSRLTMTDIAAHSGMLRPNLAEALADKRGIPTSKQEELLLTLGMENYFPSPDKIHYWKIGVDLTPLQSAVNAFFPDGAEIAGLWREGGKVFDLNRAMDKQQFAIYDDRTLVVLIRSSLGVHMPLAQQVGPETIAGLRWKGDKVGSDTMVSLPKTIITALELGTYEDMNTLRQLIDAMPSVSWDDVLTYAKQQWSAPKEALDDLVELNNSRQKRVGPRI
jgi:hypothetical protein